MIILAIYYTFADIVLIAQCFYYRGFTFRDPKPGKSDTTTDGEPTEHSPLMPNGSMYHPAEEEDSDPQLDSAQRTRSRSSFRERLTTYDGTHLSPATPMHQQPKDADGAEVFKPSQPRSWTQAILFNSTAVLLVVAAGIVGYYLSPSRNTGLLQQMSKHSPSNSASGARYLVTYVQYSTLHLDCRRFC